MTWTKRFGGYRAPASKLSTAPVSSLGVCGDFMCETHSDGSSTSSRTRDLSRVKSAKVPDWYTARRVGETVYGYKTIIAEDTGCILGAHIVGPDADEVINLFGIAIRHELTADDLKSTIFAYPT